jgi:hypothetical protein
MLQVAQSPSAAERIAAATDFLRSLPSATEILIVGALREAVDDFVREFVRSTRATFGLHRFSLTQLAARLALARLASEGAAPGTTIGAEAIAVRAAYEAQSNHEFRYFAPVAAFPGFAHAAGATLSELRAAGVSPKDLDRLDESGPDTAVLLERFQEQMREASVSDRTNLLRTAAEEVQHGSEFAEYPLLLLDVPVHTTVEREFVIALATKSPQVLITYPTGDLRTVHNLRTLPATEVPAVQRAWDSSLARVGNYLFSEEIPPEGKPDDEVVFFSAPGEERECVEIARRILVEARSGVRFDQMGVLLRAPECYASLVEAALQRTGIPAYFARGSRRPDPSGRAFLALLACAAEGLSARRFAEYLSFAQVPTLAETGAPPDARAGFVTPEDDALEPAAAGSPEAVRDGLPRNDEDQDEQNKAELAGNLRTPWKWEQFIVEAAVIGGKERWTRRIDGLENQFRLELDAITQEEPDSPRIPALERNLLNLHHLRAFALPVIDELASFPESATWGEWITALERLVSRVLRQPERVLVVLADMKPMSPVASVSLDEVRVVLQHWLANLQQEPPESRYGRVLVATPEQARGRAFEVVFIPGLAERMFPQKLREDPLLLDALRKRVSTDLPVLPDRSHQERLMLQIGVGAARRRLYLSYPRLEVAEARPRVPSFYALDVARSITGRVPDHHVLAREAELAGECRLAWPAPKERLQAVDDSEYDLATLWPLVNANVPRAGRLAYVMKLNKHLARSLRGRWARWQEKWSEYDGLFTKRKAIAEILEDQRLGARAYSVSALQKYAACPYRFLLSGIYRLEPRKEPEPLEELDPLTKGKLFHRIQAELGRALKKHNLLPVRAMRLAKAMKLLDGTVDRVARDSYDELAPAIDRVWQDAIESMRSDLRVWLQKVAEEEDGWVPIHFEFGFGFSADGQRDPASLQDPVVLPSGQKLHGVVDLIERSEGGKDLRVTDHKTGKAVFGKGGVVGQGEYLQPVLYGLAIEGALKQPVVEGRFFYCTTAGGFSVRSVPLDETARSRADAVLSTIDKGIAGPFLAPAPREEACAYCDFLEVCGPYEEIRLSKKKEIPQLVQLNAMRDLT